MKLICLTLLNIDWSDSRIRTAKIIATSKGKKLQTLIDDVEQRAKKIVAEAGSQQQDALIKAKDTAVKILEEARIEEKRAAEELKTERAALTERENTFGGKLLELEDSRKVVETQKVSLVETVARIEEMKKKKPRGSKRSRVLSAKKRLIG